MRPRVTQLRKNYFRTYVDCGSLLTVFAFVNIAFSVQNMYTSNTAQEYEFQKDQIVQSIRSLEQQKSAQTNLRSVHAQASAEGFTEVTTLKYLEAPLAQTVAQR
jgi:hypothetical protein